MAALHITVILSALALLPHGAVAEAAHKPLVRKANPEPLPHGALPDEAPNPFIRSETARSQTMGIESVGDITMHTEQRLLTIRSKKEDTDGADDVGAEDKGEHENAFDKDEETEVFHKNSYERRRRRRRRKSNPFSL
jgi:hypothetical protein